MDTQLRAAFFSDDDQLRRLAPGVQLMDDERPAHYNLIPSAPLPVLLNSRNDGQPQLKMVTWGSEEKKSDREAFIHPDRALDSLKRNIAQPAVILINGYYIWKKGREKEHPFFVRLLRESLLRVASVLFRGNESSISMIMTESNPLIYPISETMPLLLSQDADINWRAGCLMPDELIKLAGHHFQLTDYSVLRVSKKVNDPESNHESLIQPIPK